MSIVLLLAFTLATTSKPAQRDQWLEDKKSVHSADGRYELTIAPRHLYAVGDTDYLLTKQGAKVWSGTKPFFLYQAVLGNDGAVIGYSYNTGMHGMEGKKGAKDQMILWHLNPDGKEQTVTSWKREYKAVDAPPTPLADDLLSIGAQDRAILFFDDFTSFPNGSHIYTYSLSTGKPLADWPSDKLSSKGQWHLRAQQEVTGAPLVLLTWINDSIQLKAILVDSGGNSVWSKQFDTLTAWGDQNNEKNRPYLRDEILPCETPGHFAIYLGKNRVEYETKQTGTGWTADEVSTTPYDPEAISKSAWTSVPQLPAPKLIKTIKLQGHNAPKPAVHGVRNFVLAGPHRFAYIENWPYLQGNLMWIDDTGKVLGKIDLKKLELPPSASVDDYAWLGNGRVLILGVDMPGADNSGTGLLADFKTGTLKRVKIGDPDSVEHLAVFPDGKIAVTEGFGQSLSIYDRSFNKIDDGELLRKDRNYNLSADALAIDTRGRLLALDTVGRVLGIFDERGRQLKIIDLGKVFPEMNYYICDISATPDGGFIIYDSVAGDSTKKKSMYFFNANAKLVKSFRPRYKDGKKCDGLGAVTVDPQHRIWGADDESLAELDPNGIVKRVIGASPTAGAITSISDWEIGKDGSIYLLDQRTMGLFAFNPQGKLKYRFQPSAGQLKTSSQGHPIQVMRDGSVLIMDDDSAVIVNPDGKFGGKKKARAIDFRYGSGQTPDGSQWHIWFSPPLQKIDATGKVIKSIDHRPDGGLLGNGGIVVASPQGDICVSTGPASSGMGVRMTPVNISFYGGQGDPQTSFQVPDFWMDSMPSAYDGKRVLFETEDEIFASDTKGKLLWRTPTRAIVGNAEGGAKISPDCTQYMVLSRDSVRFYALPARTEG